VSNFFAPKVSPSEKAGTKAVNTAKVKKPVRRLQLQYGSAKPRSLDFRILIIGSPL
jgi:hypothetical protein